MLGETLPEGWSEEALLEIVYLPQGQVDPTTLPYLDQPLIAPDHIEPKTGRLLSVRTAAEQEAVSGKYAFGPNQVLYSKIRPYLRKAILSNGSGTCSADMYPLKPTTQIDPRVLLAVVLSERFSRFAESLSQRSGIPKLNREELADYRFYLPPLLEQRRIAEILVTLDEAILKTEQVIAKLQQMKEGLLHDLLTRGVDKNGELRDPERFPEQFKPSPLGRIPQGWEFGPLKRWLNRNPKNGYSPPEADRPTGIAMLGLGCLTRSGFEPKQIKYAPTSIDRTHYAILQDGDLLISRANTRPSVGMVGVYNDIGKPCIYPDLMIRLVATRDTSASFLEKILQSHNSRRQIEALAVGTSESMVKISSKIVQELQVAIPTPGEQEAILEILHRKKDILSMEVQDLKKLQTLKQGLMDDLLTGRVRVHVGKEAKEEASVHA